MPGLAAYKKRHGIVMRPAQNRVTPKTEGGNMAKKNQQAFAKRKKEMERKRKAQEKMAKRQNKVKETTESGKEDI